MDQNPVTEIKKSEVQVFESDSLLAITRAEIDMQISTAKKYPREISRCMEKIFQIATVDKETAEKCWYALPRDGKVIEGPSIRLAEIVAVSYQNLRADVMVVSVGQKTVKAQATCLDLENNVGIRRGFEQKIVTKTGHRYSEDMIVTTSNAACSKALRNVIFSVVPMALFKGVLGRIRKVSMGDERTFKETTKAAYEKLISFGAKKDDILRILKLRTLNDAEVRHVALMHGMITAIDEGTSTVEEMFTEKKKSGKPVVDMPTEKGKGKDGKADQISNSDSEK